ncbi:MAG: hypothetical protein JWO38_1444 [Gemmataceae bacterium]|nr:hypothetical protein [Gemmataceae bacterium]
MAARTKSLWAVATRALAAGGFLWAYAIAVPAFAYDYGLGSYGSGAYNVGQLDATTISLTSSANPSTVGQSIRLTATVSPGTATGTVTFKDGSTSLGTATLGHASGSLTTSALTAGSHTLTAVYGGNVTHSGSTSLVLTQVVNAAAGAGSSSGGGTTDSGGGGGGGRRTLPSATKSSNSSASRGASSVSRAAVNPSHLSVPINGETVVFWDVPESAWFASYVSTLIEKGIASGYRDAEGNLTGEFGVSNPVTAAEILKMALVAAGRPLSSGLPQNPSARDDWSAPYVTTAEDLRFSVYAPSLDVHKPATRGQVIQTILEVFGDPIAAGENPFTDLSASSPFAPALQTAYQLGIISGDTDAQGNPTGTVRPNDPVNRAEAAKIVSIALATLKPRPLTTSSDPSSSAAGSEMMSDSGMPYRVNTYSLKLRAARQIPSLLYGMLSEGDLVTVVGIENGWAELLLPDGRHAFVVAEYLTEVK